MTKKYTADPTKLGKRLRQVIKRGVATKAKIEEMQGKLKALEAEMIGIVATFEDRDPTDDVELTAGPEVPGKVSVKWGHDYVVDPKKAEKLREELGDAEFFRCFSVKTSYSRARSHGTWLREAHGSLDAFKDAIKDAVTKITRKKPTIKWEIL